MRERRSGVVGLVRLGAVVLAALAVLGWTAESRAQAPGGVLADQARALIPILNAETGPETLFTDEFLKHVPRAQFDAIGAQLRSQWGRAVEVRSLVPKGEHSGTVTIGYERGTVTMAISIEPGPPHRIAGLVITGQGAIDDSAEKLLADIEALPGTAALTIRRLDEKRPPLAAREESRPLAIGSTFKLVILAELARSIEAGERRWEDVVRLDRKSLPSGLLQDWPDGAPLTLHSAAALMISRSDNSATDLLLHTLGRERIEAIQTTLGIGDPRRNIPFLSTLEAFALKADPGLAARWKAGDGAARRALLAGPVSAVVPSSIAIERLGVAPSAIESVEWFYSTEDLARVIDWLRLNGGQQALDILAINPGIGRDAADRQGYLGYKGGSEPGVINMTFLVRTRAGAWFAVSGTWNDPSAAIDEARFAGLMTRAVALIP